MENTPTEVQSSTPLTTAIAAILGISALTGGSIYSLDQSQISDLNDTVATVIEERDTAIDAKAAYVKLYIASEEASGRTPTIDMTYTSQEEVVAAANEIIRDAGLQVCP